MTRLRGGSVRIESSSPFVLVAHPSPDLYGSDRQLVESIEAMLGEGWRVVVFLPRTGPLVELLEARGVEVEVLDVPVLRKSAMGPAEILRLAVRTPADLFRLRRLIRRLRPDVLYVNTLTIPSWIVASRLARTAALCHVHEAEEQQRRLVRRSIAAPLLAASHIVVNSRAAGRALTDVIGRLSRRIQVVHNGVAGPPDEPLPRRARQRDDPATALLVARLSPRKGIDIALDAVGRLRREGRQINLVVCGSSFEGYEWYERELRDRIAKPDLVGHVDLAGYRHPTWPMLEAADIVLVPSRAEPFGNTAVEGMHARRPVVASNVQGLAEVVDHDRTGLLVAPDDSAALASGIAQLLDDPDRAAELAVAGLKEAQERFSVERYRGDIVVAVKRLLGSSSARSR